ncbi:uncharacterized protein LOC143855088 isoform X8 [Tasmannia lanceolata]|uniref:uncharacterized protein LOC143855088 isoform X8 n=1 Tax=Tasmannia lanceolata TaxID=3420 RepID=UPI0040636653
MEFKAKKKMPSRADTFVITHTKKDGEAADPKSKEIMAKIKERQEQNPEPESSGIPSRDDLFGQLMGEETRGECNYGRGADTSETTNVADLNPPPGRQPQLHGLQSRANAPSSSGSHGLRSPSSDERSE